MKVVYLSNFFNHHQKPLSDNLFKLTNGNYWFIETWDMPEEQRTLGYQKMSEPYVLKYEASTKEKIERLIFDADVVQYGEAPLSLIKKRVRAGKLVIRDDECRYRNWTKFFKWPVYTYNSLYLNKGYLLCASAYAPIDYLLSGMPPRKCFKWGYFTEVKKYTDIDALISKRDSASGKVKILWVGRLVKLKHPESVVYIANHLRKCNINFEISIIGVGKEEKTLRKKINKNELESCITLLGAMPPQEVRKHMELSDVFLFTSDRNEGWGAVLNESMNSACAVVAGNNIGSVPYLIKDGVNGLIFKDKNWTDLAKKVEWLATHEAERKMLSKNAYYTMVNIWNADNASRNLLKLYDALLNHTENSVVEGPCSDAPIMLRTLGKFKTL